MRECRIIVVSGTRRSRPIEREYVSMRLAADRLLEDARRDPKVLGREIDLRHIVGASVRLEGTYVIRLFAEFETGLRLYWATIRETEPPTQHLLDGIAARRAITPERLASAHAVREYRNSLVGPTIIGTESRVKPRSAQPGCPLPPGRATVAIRLYST